MKIDLIGPSYPFRGGVSHYTTLLYKSLKKRHEIKFYSFKRQYPGFLYPGRTDKDQSSFILKDDETERILDSLNPLTWIRVAAKIIEDSPQLVIIPWWVIFWIPQFLTITVIVKVFSKVQILFLCHNVEEHERNSIKGFLSKNLLSKGDYFIVHSSEERKRLREFIGEKVIIEAFHPIYDFLNTGVIPKNEAKQKIGISDERVILFFGFVRKYKGLRYLIEAMPEILRSLNVRLLIAGEFWKDKERYICEIESLGVKENITIIDKYIPNEEVPYYFYASDIVVLPYTSVTGSGLVQLAYGFNKPVVVTKIGALKEVVVDKKTGFLISPKDSSGIAKAVLKFYKEYKEEEFARNIRAEKDRFSWDLLIKKIEESVR